MHLILPILNTIVGCFATVIALVLLLAGSANSKPAQWKQMKASMIIVSIFGASGLIVAIWLMVVGKPMPAAVVGVLPLAASITTLLVLHRLQS